MSLIENISLEIAETPKELLIYWFICTYC